MNTATKLPEPKAQRVKPISGFQTTDGKIFDLRMQAEEHQNKLDFFEWCKANIEDQSDVQIAEAIWAKFSVTPRDE